MTYSIIQKSQLEGALRLDADYYQPKYLFIDQIINRLKVITLDSISEKITQGPNPVFESTGRICLNGRNIKNNRVEENNSNFISEGEYTKFKNYRIKSGDLLITLKGLGSIGKIGYVQQNIDAIFSRDVGLIRINDKYLSAYIFAFLLSKYGRQQIEKSISGGTGQLTLGTTSIKNFKIPKIKYKSISFLVHESENQFEESNSSYSQAVELLLTELELEKFKSKQNSFSIVSLSDCQKANRIDADYFQPKYAELISKLMKSKTKKLSEVLENVPAKFNPNLEVEKEFSYVELSNIDSSSGMIDGATKLLGREAPSRAKRLLRENDVVVSSVEGSMGKVALVGKDQEGFLASSGFFQFRSKVILPEVLLALAKSIVFKYQLQQRCAGTILTAVPQESIQEIIVPILSNSTQQKIAGLVKNSHQARKKSKELLEKAKRKVEELIEG